MVIIIIMHFISKHVLHGVVSYSFLVFIFGF